MMIVHKHFIPICDGVFSIVTFRGARILSAQLQDGQPQLWMLVDDAADRVERRIRIVGTGWRLSSDPGKHIDTIQDGSLVWHIFDAGEAQSTL